MWAERLRAAFGPAKGPVRVVRAPYRICPLGAHIDHQWGTVTALAIEPAVHLAYEPADGPEVQLRSGAYAGEVRFRLDAPIAARRGGDWGNYARGAAAALSGAKGPLNRGIRGWIAGAWGEEGLSSSAAVGLAYLHALAEVNGSALTASEAIRLDQQIENGYLNLRNGILDPASILVSRSEELTVIDCRAFGSEEAGMDASGLPTGIRRIPKPVGRSRPLFLLAFSGLRQSLATTEYNDRVAECEAGARILLEASGHRGGPAVLGRVTAEEYERRRGLLAGAPARRAAHFFSEMRRVAAGIRAWAAGDLDRFGSLMTESGRSSIEQYECGCPPLIDLYEILAGAPGVLGARFSGAGFRGCCIALVRRERAEDAMETAREAYVKRHPKLGEQWAAAAVEPADGLSWICAP